MADDQIKAPDDNPTIGMLLCKTKNQLVAEYALSGTAKPMRVAEYKLRHALPERRNTSLPSVEQLEEGLNASLKEEVRRTNKRHFRARKR